jgi:hypothetical protein
MLLLWWGNKLFDLINNVLTATFMLFQFWKIWCISLILNVFNCLRTIGPPLFCTWFSGFHHARIKHNILGASLHQLYLFHRISAGDLDQQSRRQMFHRRLWFDGCRVRVWRQSWAVLVRVPTWHWARWADMQRCVRANSMQAGDEFSDTKSINNVYMACGSVSSPLQPNTNAYDKFWIVACGFRLCSRLLQERTFARKMSSMPYGNDHRKFGCHVRRPMQTSSRSIKNSIVFAWCMYVHYLHAISANDSIKIIHFQG